MEYRFSEALRNGDESAYKVLFDSHYLPLVAFVNKFFPNSVHISKDIVQNVFINLYQNRRALVIETDIKGYLFKSVYNACLNELKKESTRAQYHAQYYKYQHPIYFEQALEQTEEEHRIYEAIEKLPNQCRKIFIMSRLEGKKNQEIADELSLSIRTVETQISLALKTLRKSLLMVFYLFF